MRLLYLHLPRFPVQRKVMETPSLSGKPVVLHQERSGSRRVAFASTAAQKAGIRPGMTLTAATALEPSLHAFLYAPAEESAALQSLGESLLRLGPAFELDGPEGLYLDASAAKLCGGEDGLCDRALSLLAELGFRARAVVAAEKFTCRALARFGEKRQLSVLEGTSALLLSPLPLSALEGEGEVLWVPLASLGLRTFGEVAALPSGAVSARLGEAGHTAQRRCRGEDDAAFVPAPLKEQIEERIELDWPAEAMEPLLFALKTTLERVCGRLAGRARAAVRLSVSFRLDPSGTEKVDLRLARPSAAAKLLLDLVRHRIEDLTLPNPVVGLGVRVEESQEDRGQQLTLGDGPEGDSALEVVLSRLATTLGEEALFSAQLADGHRPERATGKKRFSPPLRQQGLLAGTGDPKGKQRPPKASLERPTRLFSQAATLEAELGSAGMIVSARLLGKRRKATAVAGPERLAGDWWSREPYGRDYYRIQFEGLGPVWVFRDERDGRFYLQGMFD